MKKTLLAFVIAFGLVGSANAQQSVAVDINKASLAWQWAPDPSGGVPTQFNVKCGQTSGSYTKVTPVTYPTTTLAVKLAINGSGNWFCAVSAQNQFGESANSNEVPFAAGALPSAPSSLVVQGN